MRLSPTTTKQQYITLAEKLLKTCQIFYNNTKIFVFVFEQEPSKQNQTIPTQGDNAHEPVGVPKNWLEKQLIH